MKILQVSNYFEDHLGGIEKVALYLAARLADAGYTVSWAAFAEKEPAGEKRFKRIPLFGWNLGEKRLGLPLPLLRPAACIELVRKIVEHDLILVHDCLYFQCASAIVLSWLLRKPLVIVQHVGIIPYRSKLVSAANRAAHRLLSNLLLKLADQVIFCSGRVEQAFSRCMRPGSPSLLIRTGVDLQLFSPGDRAAERPLLCRRHALREDALLVLFVGRFVEKKGIGFIRDLSVRLPDCSFLCVGAGPLNPSAWPCANLRTCGPLEQSELVHYYRAADLLILPAVGEGYPLVIQEAMSCGLPCLVSAEIAALEQDWGHLVQPSALTIEALTEALSALAKQRHDLESLRSGARRYAETHWDWSRTMADYIGVFKALGGFGA